jgi:hypothetical protein
MRDIRMQLKSIQRIIEDILNEHGLLPDRNEAFIIGRLPADEHDDFICGTSGSESPNLGAESESTLSEDEACIEGFKFTVNPGIRYTDGGQMSIINNRNNPLIPPVVTPVPGETNTYLDDRDADRVYRLMPMQEDSDQGYLFIYYRKVLLAIIEGFSRCGGFRREI